MCIDEKLTKPPKNAIGENASFQGYSQQNIPFRTAKLIV